MGGLQWRISVPLPLNIILVPFFLATRFIYTAKFFVEMFERSSAPVYMFPLKINLILPLLN